ncbi:capsule biosynthesis protein [Komagataeibacter medellinensis]|uniref:Capsule biosynthesis protein n=1 Tax=Komagataeibacter medellinensis TaxID=1177712 RepID=A0ABQ6VV69_9PROT|nr:capsule biosynthesis protein [Komagataeibacter medellinensis]KAB8124021.1 capsule biosynthesis protein [Komagataeibacter medellinensis]
MSDNAYIEHADAQGTLLIDQIKDKISKKKYLIIFVFLPTLLTFLYLTIIATPQYISEAHFIVRGNPGQSGISISSILQPSPEGTGTENAYIVQDYMESRDAASLLIKQNQLLDVYLRPEADFLARYSPLLFSGQFEHFYSYYKRHLSIKQSSDTHITVLKVRTFRAADSQKIARALLDAGEALVNKINQRQRENLVHIASMEVNEAQAKLNDINQKLAQYRNVITLIDPVGQSTPMLSFVTSLRNTLTSTQMKLKQLQQFAPASPMIAVYQNQADILAEQIRKSQSTLTGSSESLVPKITGYDDLMLQRDMQQRILISSVASQEVAKQQAEQNKLYVDEIDQPNLADYPQYPMNTLIMAIVFALSLSLYGTVIFLINMINI